MRWIVLMLGVMGCGLLSGADYVKDFLESGRNPMLVWPRKYAADWKPAADGWRLTRTADVQGKLCVYSYIALPPGTAVLSGKVRYRAVTANGGSGDLTLTLYFNKQDGGNGSAGQKTLPMPLSAQFRDFTFSVPVPKDAVKCQYAFGLKGGEGELALRKIELVRGNGAGDAEK